MHLEKGSAAILDLSAADWATQSQVQGAVRLELDLVDEQDGNFRRPELLHLEKVRTAKAVALGGCCTLIRTSVLRAARLTGQHQLRSQR